jgi:hypothetical protein
LLDSGTFKGISGAPRERALKASQRLGYELFVNGADLPATAALNQRMHLALTITNTGVAPLYHRWPVRLALQNSAGRLTVWTNLWDLTSVQPNAPPARFETEVSLDGLTAGPHAALLSIANPLPQGQSIRFANEAEDVTQPGWLTLGTIEVRTPPRLKRPQIREGRFEMQLEELRVGAPTEVLSALAGSVSWEVLDRFSAPATTMVWSHEMPPGQGTCFRVRQRD